MIFVYAMILVWIFFVFINFNVLIAAEYNLYDHLTAVDWIFCSIISLLGPVGIGAVIMSIALSHKPFPFLTWILWKKHKEKIAARHRFVLQKFES